MDTTTISNRELLIKNITEIATAKPTETPTNHVQTVREQTVIILPLTTTTTLPTRTTIPTTTTTTTAIPTTVRATTIQTTIPTTTTTTTPPEIIPIVDTTTTLKTTQFEIPEDPSTTKSTNTGTTNAFDRNINLWQELLRFQPAVMHSTTEVVPIFTREIVTSTTTIPSTTASTTTSKPVQRFEDINVLVSLKHFFFLIKIFNI